MKIGKPTDNATPLPTVAPSAGGAAGAASPPAEVTTTAIPAQADPSAKIELSSAGSSFLAGTSAPEFDGAKVDRVTQSIQDGSYKVNAEVIADKLLANAQELLSSTKG